MICRPFCWKVFDLPSLQLAEEHARTIEQQKSRMAQIEAELRSQTTQSQVAFTVPEPLLSMDFSRIPQQSFCDLLQSVGLAF